MSQSYLFSTTFPCMGPLLTLSSTWVSQAVGEGTLGDEYNEPTQGEFAMTHAAHVAALQKISS